MVSCHWRRAILVGLSVLAWAGPALGQETSPPAPVERPEEAQATPPSTTSVRAYWTQFVGAPVSGPGDSNARYGGNLDAYLTLDGRDIGLWNGLTINVHPELRYGESVNGRGGTLLPPNIALSLPSNSGEDFDLALNFTQRIGRASLTFGKINMLDIVSATPLLGGGGRDGFQHTAFAAPPSVITPPAIFGALLTVPLGRPTVTLGVWDAASAVNRTGFENMFETGVSGMVSLTLPVSIRGKLGIHSLAIQGTTKRGLDLNDIPDIFLPPESEVVLGQKRGGVLVRYAWYQFLWQDPANPRRGWGFFLQSGLWDDNPIPLRWSVIAGLSGSPPIASRPADRFGIGYFRVSLSAPLRAGLAPLLAIGDEQGTEAFYTFQIGKYVRLTADLQYVDPFIRGLDPSLFLGTRLRLGF